MGWENVIEPTETANPRVAVAIPCYNEAAAVATVVGEWRDALPDAEVVIFDNNSTDDTAAIARGLGVRVVEVPRRAIQSKDTPLWRADGELRDSGTIC